ncbi:uncharacterized protein LOC130732558 [Lotus japonicus]|uniref:uncharacterized protein LOC130732558 n=1 Tax=Lotus japonicus TaxID=34305 RepID=UPI002582BC7B|nr:uncharacterized protein LOC130732558 [Lotus japonicus]
MEKKPFLKLLVILLGLSCFGYAVAVPATRSSMIWKVDPSILQDHLAKDDHVMGLRNNQGVLEIKEEAVESRMLVDVADYPGTRPNPSHNPKPPAKH